MIAKLFKTENVVFVIIEGNGYSFYLSLDEARKTMEQIGEVLEQAKTTNKGETP